jgi:hypothetical protein
MIKKSMKMMSVVRVADRPNMNAVLTNPDYLWGMRSIL